MAAFWRGCKPRIGTSRHHRCRSCLRTWFLILTDLDAFIDPPSLGLSTIIKWQILIFLKEKKVVLIHLRLIFQSHTSGLSRPCPLPFWRMIVVTYSLLLVRLEAKESPRLSRWYDITIWISVKLQLSGHPRGISKSPLLMEIGRSIELCHKLAWSLAETSLYFGRNTRRERHLYWSRMSRHLHFYLGHDFPLSWR